MNRLKSVWLVVAVSLVAPAIAQTSVSDKATMGDSAAMNMRILRQSPGG